MADKKFDESNSGILGINDYKQKDTHPDHRGRALIGGLWYWVSGWDKQSYAHKFISLAFTEMTQDEVDRMMAKREEKAKPQQPQQQTTQQPEPQQSRAEGAPNPDAQQHFDSDIPF